MAKALMSDINQALVEREIPEWKGRADRIGPDTGLLIIGSDLARLLDAAREEGRMQLAREQVQAARRFMERREAEEPKPPAPAPRLFDTVRQFFELRLSQKRDICERLGLPIGPSDGPDFEQYKGAIRAASEQGKLAELNDAIRAAKAAG